jgi:hypothetical protein
LTTRSQRRVEELFGLGVAHSPPGFHHEAGAALQACGQSVSLAEQRSMTETSARTGAAARVLIRACV